MDEWMRTSSLSPSPSPDLRFVAPGKAGAGESASPPSLPLSHTKEFSHSQKKLHYGKVRNRPPALPPHRGRGRAPGAARHAPQEPVPLPRRPPCQPDLQREPWYLPLLRVRCPRRPHRPGHAPPGQVVPRGLPMACPQHGQHAHRVAQACRLSGRERRGQAVRRHALPAPL